MYSRTIEINAQVRFFRNYLYRLSVEKGRDQLIARHYIYYISISLYTISWSGPFSRDGLCHKKINFILLFLLLFIFHFDSLFRQFLLALWSVWLSVGGRKRIWLGTGNWCLRGQNLIFCLIIAFQNILQLLFFCKKNVSRTAPPSSFKDIYPLLSFEFFYVLYI